MLDYGLEGYGLYWYCIELIAGKVDKDNITFELEHDARIIARNVGSTPQKVEEMMRYFVEIGLFENSHGVITCMKLARRLDKSMTSNPQMREIIDNFRNHDGVMTESGFSHDRVMIKSEKVMQDKTRTEENKGDKEKIDRVSDAFDKFWSSYHKKQGKTQALKAFRQAVKREKPATPDEFADMLIDDCRKRIDSGQFGFDNLNASTYLNNNRWEDEIVTKSTEKSDDPWDDIWIPNWDTKTGRPR